MTILKTKPRKARPLALMLMAAVATPLFMAAPMAATSALAAPNGAHNDNSYKKRKAPTAQKQQQRQQPRQQQRQRQQPKAEQQKRREKPKVTSQRRRDWKADRRAGHGDWSNDQERQRRLERAQREQRQNNANAHARNQRQVRQQRNNQNRVVRNQRTRTQTRHNTYRRPTQHRTNNRYWRRNNNTRYYANNRHGYRGWNAKYNGFHSTYRSSIGINFIFGHPGYSRYRWASSPYAFYRPGQYSYAQYQENTWCERVLIEANHHGHIELISVMQCTNPYEGSYIVQGSEQLVDCRY